MFTPPVPQKITMTSAVWPLGMVMYLIMPGMSTQPSR